MIVKAKLRLYDRLGHEMGWQQLPDTVPGQFLNFEIPDFAAPGATYARAVVELEPEA